MIHNGPRRTQLPAQRLGQLLSDLHVVFRADPPTDSDQDVLLGDVELARLVARRLVEEGAPVARVFRMRSVGPFATCAAQPADLGAGGAQFLFGAAETIDVAAPDGGLAATLEIADGTPRWQLRFDGETERFIDNDDANGHLKPTYRPPYVMPDEV